MKTIRIVCFDDTSPSKQSIIEFYMPDDVVMEKVKEEFQEQLINSNFNGPDRVAYAACAFAQKNFTRFERYPVDIALLDEIAGRCSCCGDVVYEGEGTACLFNEGFEDEGFNCWDCRIDKLENSNLTCCESCGNDFTYNHLLKNRDSKDGEVEICPYCGEVWCE